MSIEDPNNKVMILTINTRSTFHSFSYVLLSLIILAAVSCNITTDTKTSQNDLQLIAGQWIMTDYIDSILGTKNMIDHSKHGLTSLAIVVEIKNDTLTYEGLILAAEKLNLNSNYDSLTLLNDDFQLSYNPARDILSAKSLRNTAKSKDSLVYSFGRVKENEKRLMKGIGDPLFRHKLEANLNAFFIDSLISGHYKSLSGNTTEMTLEKTGDSSGFGDYTEYKLIDHFGTHHPFGNEDVIIFTNTAITNDGNGPPTNIGIYSWEINVDTLIFTKMLTEDHENFYKGSERFRFVREGGSSY